MTRFSGVVARALAAAVSITVLLHSGSAFSQTAATEVRAESAVSAIGSRTAEELSACLQRRPNLAVAMLIDETGSLRQTDPDDERAEVLAGFLARLEDLAGTEAVDRTRQVLVTIAYFGTGVDEFLPWQSIDTPQPGPASDPSATRSIAQTIREVTPERKRDLTTEFSDAIAWATDRHLAVASLLDPASVCTLTVWFSDGELDPDNQPNAPYEREAVIAETARLCDAGGVLDDHRRSGAALVGILLVERVTASSSVTTLPRMQAMVEGVDPDARRCGEQASRGLYLEGGLDLLSLRFERAVTPGQGGVLQGTYLGDPVTFVVDPGVARIRVVMSAREGFRLTTATGGRIEVARPGATPSTSGLPRGVQPDIRWASGAVSLDLAVGDAFGQWTIDERQGRATEVDVYYFSDLRIDIDLGALQLTSGEEGVVEGRVLRGDGSSADLQLYASRSISVVVDGVDAASELRPDGTFRAVFSVNTDEARIPGLVQIDLTTAGGTELQPVKRELLLPVTLPGWFPRVDIAQEFDRSLAPGRGEARLAIVATGSELGATRVCVRPGAPGDGSQDLARLVTVGWNAPDLSRCIDLALGERVDAAIVATLQGTEVRQVRVAVPLIVTLESAAVDGRPSVTVDYPESRSVVVEPAPPNRFIVLFLLLLGLLVPLAILHLLNRSAARFRSRNLQHARVPVDLVRASGAWSVVHRDRAAGPLLSVDEFTWLPNDELDGKDRWTASNLHLFGNHASSHPTTAGESWRAVVPKWPLGTVSAAVDAPAGHRIISNEAPTVRDDGSSAGIGLNPQRAAYLLVRDEDLAAIDDIDDVRVPATLVTVLGHGGVGMETMVTDHGGQLETIMTGGSEVDTLVAAARAATPVRAVDDGAGTGAAGEPGASGSGWSTGGGSSDGWGSSTPGPSGGPWGSPPSREGGGGRTPSGWD